MPSQLMNAHKISWWRTSFGEEEVEKLREAVANEHITAGPLTEQLEQELAESLGVPYAVVTTSGSSALLMALMALGIGKDDEVIVPNRGWIAAAHAVLMAGAKVVLVDVCADSPVMDPGVVRKKITPRAKAIMPVHLNGRTVNMEEVQNMAKEYNLHVVEDACQALFSKNARGFLGTQSEIGCFSLGIGKLISTGQGGFAVTHRQDLYEQMKLIRNHGVKDIFTNAWSCMGFNFKFTDLLASFGLVQLQRAEQRIKYLHQIYAKYDEVISGLSFLEMIPVKVSAGELPLYIEVLCPDRDKFVQYMQEHEVQVRLFAPNMNVSPYIASDHHFPHSDVFNARGMFLPCGPAQPMENIEKVIDLLKVYESQI